jgi:hypothetical protein
MPDDREVENAPAEGRSLGPVAPVIGLIAPDHNPGGAIYGTVTIGVLLAAEASRAETYSRTLDAIAAALFLYWLAHGYAHVAGRRLSEKESYTIGSVFVALGEELAILRGAAIPFLAVILCWLANARLSVGITAGIWSAVGVLLAIELIAGIRARLSFGALMVQTSVGALFGITILVLRSLLH